MAIVTTVFFFEETNSKIQVGWSSAWTKGVLKGIGQHYFPEFALVSDVSALYGGQ